MVMDASDIELVEFRPGDYLFHENETSYHFYILQEGQVEVYQTGKDNRGIVKLATVGPRTALGEFAMIDRKPRSATARAITSVRAARISEEAYTQLFHELPEWAATVMRSLVERLRHMNEVVRQASVADPSVIVEMEAIEYDNTATLSDTNPDLRPPTDDPEDT